MHRVDTMKTSNNSQHNACKEYPAPSNSEISLGPFQSYFKQEKEGYLQIKQRKAVSLHRETQEDPCEPLLSSLLKTSLVRELIPYCKKSQTNLANHQTLLYADNN